jgi:hypothetical protein
MNLKKEMVGGNPPTEIQQYQRRSKPLPPLTRKPTIQILQPIPQLPQKISTQVSPPLPATPLPEIPLPETPLPDLPEILPPPLPLTQTLSEFIPPPPLSKQQIRKSKPPPPSVKRISIPPPIENQTLEFLENPKEIKFEPSVPIAIRKLLEELYGKIIKYKTEVGCCFKSMTRELNSMRNIDIIHKTQHGTVRGEQFEAIYGTFTDYVKVTPDFTRTKNEQILGKVIPFLNSIVHIYANMMEIMSDVKISQQGTITPSIKNYIFKPTDIWNLYNLYYKKFVDKSFESCNYFINEIKKQIILQNKPYFNIITERPTGECDENMFSNAPYLILVQQLVRFSLLLNEIEKEVKKLNVNVNQEKEFEMYSNKIKIVIDNLNELQRRIEKNNKEIYGVELIKIQIRDKAEISKLTHHCEVCNTSKDMKKCCVGDCKIDGVISKKCIYSPRK